MFGTVKHHGELHFHGGSRGGGGKEEVYGVDDSKRGGWGSPHNHLKMVGWTWEW